MNAVIIYNPNAMKGKVKKKLPYIQKRLQAKYEGCELFETLEDCTDTENMVISLCNNYDVIISIGGDGTIHYIANGIAKSGKNVILGVLPYGTVNDVAHNLKVPKNLNRAIDIILRGYVLDYDLISDGKNYIIYTLGGGIFVSSSFSTTKRLKSTFGRMAYIIKGIGCLFRHKPLPLTIESEDYRENGKYMLCLVLNSYSTAGFYINGQSSLNDKKMEVVLIRRARLGFFGFLRALGLVLRLFLFGLRSVKNSKDVKIIYTSNVKIENHSDADFTVDGEKSNFLNKELIIKKHIQMFHGVNF